MDRSIGDKKLQNLRVRVEDLYVLHSFFKAKMIYNGKKVRSSSISNISLKKLLVE